MAHQGKFDALTKDLITHVLGFEEDEENFVRSEQFVLSNLLYHHCLAVNSHAVRRSIDGLCLKFTVHGQANRAQKLTELTSKFLQSSLFKDHYETDIEWSLLSLMLHLSNSPTHVPETEAELHPVTTESTSTASSQDIVEEQIDWGAYLLKGEKECEFGPEDPLSDWSDSEEEDYLRSRKNTLSYKSYAEEELFVKPKSRSRNKDWNLLEQSHRAKSWISGNTQLPYWKGPCYQHEALSSRPVATVATLWEKAKSEERSQLLSEWVVMREVLWVLMCPVSSYIFQQNEKGDFIMKNKMTLPSLTRGAIVSLLEDLCEPLKQLSELDIFMRNIENPEGSPPTPVTLLAYVAGLRHWRRQFQMHLTSLENIVKKQETTCTLVWLMDELKPWLRILLSVYSVHHTALIAYPEDCPRNLVLRLIGSLCEGVEGAGKSELCSVLLRLLLHTVRHYFSIMHNWLQNGSLVDFANEFIIERNSNVSVMDESFWKEAFFLNCHPDSKDLIPGDPLKTGLKILLPLAVALTSIGKSQELLSALSIKPCLDDCMNNLESSKSQSEREKPLEEVLVDHVTKIITEDLSSGEEATANEQSQTVSAGISEGAEKEISQGDVVLSDKQKENISHIGDILALADPMLVMNYIESDDEDTSVKLEDYLDRKIEAVRTVPRAVSVVGILSASMRPLITEKQNELNSKLTEVLIKEYQLDRHCKAVRSILLMEAGDIMHEFYSHLFSKLDYGEEVDSVSLTLHLEYCISRMYPDLSKLFTVSVESRISDNEDKEEKPAAEVETNSGGDSSSKQLSALGLPNISIHYQAPWPMNILFNQEDLAKLNVLFRFSLSLKRATYGLERLKFRDMACWNTPFATGNISEESDSPLQSRLHRLQLLRLWLLCFSRELHNYFANVVFLPYYQAFEDLIESKPSFSDIISGHRKLLDRVISLCLMKNNTNISPLQVVLNKVFWLTQQLSHLWRKDTRVSSEELSSVEAKYVQVHRFLVNILSHLTTKHFLPHLEGLTRALTNSVPLQTL
ncbi:gamma-tubulin complex component 5-like isoform X1 [Macrobrachium rosenbergii]|uniref:gamma-tubulin complex component 5-like isoform X1 n=2 Tax=Macrobrachium rosenbergii TaxID=79674 RepID=UPI0034D6EAB3